MATYINPQTGLVETKEPTVTGDPKKSTKKNETASAIDALPSVGPALIGTAPATNTYVTNKYTEPISRYQKYGDINFLPSADWNEDRARRQSTGEKWVNGLTKAAITAVGAVAENTVGAADGIIEATASQDVTKLYDNHVGRAVDRLNEWAQYNLPNYATHAEQSAEGLASLGYANFWADKVANGLGYTLGSVATVYLTGGMGMIGKAGNLAGKAGKASNAAKMLNVAKAVDSAADVTSAVAKGSSLGRTLNAARQAEIGVMMSFGESSVEAREVLNSVTEQLKADRAQELGIDPSELTQEDLDAIKSRAAESANVAFAANLAVTSATNLATFGRTLLPNYTDMKPRANWFSKNAKGEWFDQLAEMNPVKRALVKYGVPTIKGSASETAQEGMQFAIAEGAEAKALDNTVGNWTDALYHGMEETWGTKEGRESMLIGGIVGLLTGGAGSVRTALNAKEESAARAALVEAVNNPSIMRAIKSGQYTSENIQALNDAAAALEAGDHKAYRDAMGKAHFSEVMSHLERGSLDMYLERLDDISNMQEDQVRKGFGIPDGVKFNSKQAVSALKQSAKEIAELKDNIDSQFPTPRVTQGAGRLFMSKEQKANELAVAEDTNYLKNQLLKSTYGLRDADARIEKLVNEINQLDPKASLDPDEFRGSEVLDGPALEIESVDRDGKVTSIKAGKLNAETKGKLDSSDQRLMETDPSKHAEAKDKIKDLERLALDRAKAVSALQQLYASPETRDMYLSRQAAKDQVAAQTTKDNQFKDQSKKAYTIEQLEDLINRAEGLGVSTEAKQFAIDKRNNLLSTKKKLLLEFAQTPIDDLRERMETEEDEFVKQVLGEYIDDFMNMELERENFDGEEIPEDPKQEEEKAKDEIEEIRNDENAAPEYTVGKGGIGLAPGQYALIEVEEAGKTKKKIKLDYAGRPTEGSDGFDGKYAEDLKAARKLHNQNLIGRDVVFRILEDHKYTEFNQGQEKESANSAIGIYLDGQLMGLVNPNTAERKVLYSRLQEEGEVAGQVAEQVFGNNVNNVVDEDTKEKVFTPINEIISTEDIQSGNAAIGVLRYRKEGDQIVRYWDLGLDEHPLDEDAARIANNPRVLNSFSLGEAALLIKKPTGEVSALPLSTEKLSEEALGVVKNLIKKGELVDAMDIVGVSSELNPEAKLFFDPINSVIYYNILDNEDLFGMISTEDYANANLAGLKVGKLEYIDDEYEFVPVELPGEQLGPIQGQMHNDINVQLTESRFQVSSTKINGLVDIKSPITGSMYPGTTEGGQGVLDYFSNPKESGRDKPILSADFKKLNGSLFHDVKFTFSYATKAGGRQSEATGVPVAKPAGPIFTAEQLSAPLEETTEEGTPTISAESLSVTDDTPGTLEIKREDVSFANTRLKEFTLGNNETVKGYGIKVKNQPNVDLFVYKERGAGWTVIDNKSKKKFPLTRFFGGSASTKAEVLDEFVVTLDEYIKKPAALKVLVDEVGFNLTQPSSAPKASTRDKKTGKSRFSQRRGFRLGKQADKKINAAKAKEYLTKLFGDDSVVIFNQLQKVGNDVVHGYMENAAIYLYSGAAIGTEYHEAFHMFFRNFLTEAQQVGLYEEAEARYGEPTAEEIEAARRGQPIMTNAEARLLALEERMAEEMREYALDEQKPKGIGRRLFKFFKDLLAYLKALTTNKVGINQAFRMLESRRIPAKLSRKTDAFSPSPAYLLEQFSDRPAHRNELTDVAIWKLINDLDAIPEEERSLEAASALGTSDGAQDSSIRNWFLRHAFNVDGEVLTDEQFDQLKEAFDTENDALIDEIAQFGPPQRQVDGTPMPAQMLATDANGVPTAADDFLEVYEGWFDERSEVADGVYNRSRGFRSETIERLEMYGYTVTDTESKEKTNELKIEEEDIEERVYSVSRLEENPAKKISDKAKRLLSRIPIQPERVDKSIYGFQTFVPLQDAMRVISATVDGAPTLSEMMKRFDERTDNYNILKSAKQFLEGLPTQAKAVFFANFALSTNNFILPKTVTDEKGNVVVQFITPNANAARKFWQGEWKRQQTELPGGLYTTTRDRSGNILTRTVEPAALQSIAANYEVMVDERASDSQQKEALANILMTMGITIADTVEEAVGRMQASQVGVYTMIRKNTNLDSMIQNVLAPVPENGVKANVFDEADRTLLYFAKEFREKYDGPIATSFMGGNMKTYYPLNLRSLLNMTSQLVESGQMGKMMINKFGHQSGRVKKITSPLTKILNLPRFQKDFDIRDLDVSKFKKNDENLILEYENLTYDESLAIRMQLYANQNKDLGYFALDTQADRKRLTFITFPKITNRQSRERYNLASFDSLSVLMNEQIKLDLYRMADAQSVISGRQESKMIEGYHYAMIKNEETGQMQRDYESGSWKVFNAPGVDLEIMLDSTLPKSVELNLDAGAKFSEDHIALIDKATRDAVAYLEEAHYEHINELGGVQQAIDWVQRNMDSKSYAKGLEIQFLKEFTQNDIIARMMSRQMFRSGVNYTKNGADYIKRAALITTPGTVLVLQGDEALADPDYGMLPFFNEATIKDIFTSLPEEQIERLENAIGNALGDPSAAALIADEYRNINTTDAQSLISPEMYRRILMGKGLWGPEQSTAWDIFKATGQWDYKAMPVKPMKPFYGWPVELDGHLVPFADKNSYIVLTPDLIEGNPQLTNIYNRMNRPDSPIHVFNVESAKKLGRRPPFDVTQDLNEIPVTALDSRGLVFPQELPEKPEDKTNLGRQPRKNLIANLLGFYRMADGSVINADKLKQWYHNAVVDKLNRNKIKVLESFDAPESMFDLMDINDKTEVLNRVIPKVRDRLMDMAREKGFTENQMKMMDLTVRDGMIVPVIPFAFPSMDSKFGTLVLSIFRKEVYRQKMKGFEAVQFSDFTTEQDDSLQFLDMELDKNEQGVLMRHAQVDVGTGFLEELGIDPNQPLDDINAELRNILGYRIPQQGKSSMLIMQIRKILPAGYKSTVRVPAGITTQMGSDFDIDKMFLLFPETKDGKKLQTNYMNDPASTEQMSEAQLNNIIFDTFQAVLQAPQHAAEVLSPLEIPDLEIARESVGEGKQAIDIYSSATPIKTGMANMLSNALRGQHANAIAARNVLESAGAVLPLEIADMGVVVMTQEQKFNLIEYQAKFPDKYGVIRPTDYYLSQLLSAAVDSVKDPIQDSLNITSKTANMWHLLIDLGLTPVQIAPFMTHPDLRKITDIMLKYDETDVKRAVGLAGFAEHVESIDSAWNKAEGEGQIGLDLDSPITMDVVKNLYYLNKLATNYTSLGRAVTIDNIDQSGTVAQHQSKLAQIARIPGGKGIDNILYGQDYPITAAYAKSIQQSLNFMSNLGFAAEQSGLNKFKRGPLAVTKRNDEAFHRDLNRIALHWLATKPGSGLFESGLINKENIERVHLDVSDNIAFTLQELKKRYPGDALLNALSPVIKPGPNEKTIYKVELQNGVSRTARQKNDIDSSWYKMLYDTQDPQLQAFGRDLITNTVVSTGFAPGPNSLFDHIPVEFLEEIGVGSALHTEVVGRDMSSLADFSTEDFILNYGTHTFGGKHLFRTISDPLSNTFASKAHRSDYLVAIDAYGNKSLFTRVGVDEEKTVYQRANTKGIQNMLYEVHLDRSTVHSYTGPSQSKAIDYYSTQQFPTSKSVTDQITKLLGAFERAGVSLEVNFETLPKGVKGKVTGGTITLDKDQLTGDTVYHEFAHILIDRLPQDDVIRYAQQVSETNPELAMSVKAKYGELTDEEFAKELIVTAIGIEGAKIERRNPSKLQMIINKILRAIGKLFGITPNAAAQLAEDLFAGEIRQEIAEGEFNPMVQLSMELNDKVKEAAVEAKIAVEREIKRIERMGEQASKKDIALLKTLRKKLKKVEDISAEFDMFLGFQQFTTVQVAKAKRLHKKLQQYKNRKVTKEEARQLLNESNELRYILDGLFNTRNMDSTINKMSRVLKEEVQNVSPEETGRFHSIYRRLEMDMGTLVDLDADYAETIAPLVADALYEYGDEGTANTDLDVQINNLQKLMAQGIYDISGTGYVKQKETKIGQLLSAPLKLGQFFNRAPEIKKVYNNRQKITDEFGEEGFKKALVEAKIEVLKNKKVGRKELVEELTKAHRQKSLFSAYLDPLVYSNENNLQLFTNTLRAARTASNNRTIGMIQDSEEFYTRFVQYMGEENDVAKLNEKVLTTVNLPSPDGSTIEVLSIVQKTDSNKFYSNKADVIAEAAKTFNMPDPSDYTAYKAWKYDRRGATSAQYKGYTAAIRKWEMDNTIDHPKAQERYAILLEGRRELEAKIAQLELEDAEQWADRGYSSVSSDLAVLEAELNEVDDQIGKVRYGDRFIGDLAIPNPEIYTSDKWKEIQATPELKEYYDHIVDLYHSKQRIVGKNRLFTDAWNDYSYVMPSIRKEDYDRMKEQGVTSTIKDAITDGVTRQDTDTQFGGIVDNSGEAIKSIPVYYTNLVSQENVSRDVMSSLIQFGHMAHQYEEKGKIHGLVTAMTNLHERRETIREESGIPIVDVIASKVKGGEEYVTASLGESDRTFKHLQDFVDKNFYGKYEVTSAAVGGLSGQKLADRAVGYTALNSLAFNFLQIGNQAILDNLMIGQEAGAAEFFSRKNRRWALKTYWDEKGAIGDAGVFAKKTKLAQAMQMFNAMSEVTDELGRNITGTLSKKARKSDWAFMFQGAVEHQTTAVKMLSLMDATTGFVDAQGNPIEGNLWDNLIMDEKGRLMVNPEIANFSVEAFTAKLAGINRRTNQIKGSVDASAANSTVWGKLILLFKNYFVPFYRRRLGHGENYHVDLELGNVTRGFYITFFGYLQTAMANEYQFKKLYQELSPVDKRNMRRAMLEAVYVVTAMAIHSLLSRAIEDDDDDNYFLVFGAYQARRLQTELLSLLNPAETIRMFRAPMATANQAEKYWDFVMQLFREFGHIATFGLAYDEEDLIQQRTSAWAEKGERKVTGKLRKVVPYLNGLKTLDSENVEDRLRFFD